MSETTGITDPYSTDKNRGLNRFDARTVEQLHTNDDLDTQKNAHHHTLGPTANQASPGNHTHDGTNSSQLMSGITITGAKGGNVALANLIAALAPALGFTDSTT